MSVQLNKLTHRAMDSTPGVYPGSSFAFHVCSQACGFEWDSIRVAETIFDPSDIQCEAKYDAVQDKPQLSLASAPFRTLNATSCFWGSWRFSSQTRLLPWFRFRNFTLARVPPSVCAGHVCASVSAFFAIQRTRCRRCLGCKY